jgi:multicomponent Na+:H+ antiporter subunit E
MRDREPGVATGQGQPRHKVIGWLTVAWIFNLELLQSAFMTIRAILGRPERLRPAILAVPLDVRSPAGVTLFASMVTLTPGTTSLDVSDDGRTLYVHVMDAPDHAAAIAAMKASLETCAREVLP